MNISKQNTFGTEIAGAALELTGTDSDGNKILFTEDNIQLGEGAVFQNSGESLKWISGTSESIVKSIPDGSYTLHEVAAPDGYEVTTDINFTIQDGKLIGSSSNSVTMVDTMKGEVQISKSNVFGDEIKGAQLTLTGKDKNGIEVVFDIENVVLGDGAKLESTSNGTSLTWISGSTSTFVRDLPSGTYTLEELAAPSGYEVTTEIVFTLDDGRITTESSAIDGNTVTMVDDMKKTDVTISKSDVLGNELKGAVLTLTGKDLTGRDVVFNVDDVTLGNGAELNTKTNGTTLEWVSGSTSTLVKDLTDGTYTLKEKAAPSGYVVTTDIIFTIENGTVKGSSVNVNSDSGTVTMIDDAFTTDVEISKQSILGKELAGAKLTLTGKDAKGADVIFDISEVTLGKDAELVTKENGKSITWISGSTPTFIGNLVNGTYTLVENAAPSGYEVTTEMVFTVTDGVVTGGTTVSGTTVTMIDDFVLTDVSISKQNVAGDEIKGATLTLTGKDLDGKDVVFDISDVTLGTDAQLLTTENSKSLTWISGSTSTLVNRLKDGTYTIHEEAAPSGYVVTTDITFTLVDGVITGDVELDTDGSIIVLDDYAVSTTTTTGTSAKTTAASTTTTAAATTKAAKAGVKSNAPGTGDAGVGIAFVMLAMAAGTAFAVRRKKNED